MKGSIILPVCYFHFAFIIFMKLFRSAHYFGVTKVPWAWVCAGDNGNQRACPAYSRPRCAFLLRTPSSTYLLLNTSRCNRLNNKQCTLSSDFNYRAVLLQHERQSNCSDSIIIPKVSNFLSIPSETLLVK